MEQWGTGKKQLYFGVRDSYEEEGKISSGDLPSASGCTEIERIAYSKDKIVHNCADSCEGASFLHVTRLRRDMC